MLRSWTAVFPNGEAKSEELKTFRPTLANGILCTVRVHEYGRTQFFGLGPERVEARIRDVFAKNMTANRRATMSKFGHRVLELFGGEYRVLQRDRRQRDEAVRVIIHPLGQRFVVVPDDAGG